jgi:hypothetical protein
MRIEITTAEVMKKLCGPGRPRAEKEKAEKRFVLCVTPERERAYRKAAGILPANLWAKRLLDAAANYNP